MQEDMERRDAGPGSLPRSLLLATDLSCRCDRALDRAVMLAAAWVPGCRWCMCRKAMSRSKASRRRPAVRYRVPFEGFISRDANEAELLADAKRECAAFLATLDAPPDALERMEWLIRYGAPESVVGAHVWKYEIDLVMMGTHGRSGRFGILMGSTAERLLISLPCGVMVVREPSALPAAIGAAGTSASHRGSGNA